MTSDHYDVLLVLGVAALMLLILIWVSDRMMARRFRIHEQAEEKMHAAAVLTAEGASAGTRENARHIDELRLDVAAQRINVANLSELLRDQEARLVAVELRLTRAAVSVPNRHQREGP